MSAREIISKQVVLYGDSAMVTEVIKISAKDGVVEFFLPYQIDDDTVTLNIQDLMPAELNIEEREVDREHYSNLKKELMNAEDHLGDLNAEKEGVRAGLERCGKMANKAEDADQLKAIEAFLDERARTLNLELKRLDKEILDVKENIAKINTLISRRGESEKVMAVSAFLTKKDGTVFTGDATATLKYSIDDCGWYPIARLNARPSSGVIEMSRSAVITQTTGEDWDDADIVLSTNPGNSSGEPKDIQPWKINLYEKGSGFLGVAHGAMMGAALCKSNMMVDESCMDEQVEEEAPVMRTAPKVTEEATSVRWELGKRTVHSGIPCTVVLDQANWNAEFYRVLRPNEAIVSYLAADILLNNPAGMTLARTTILVDDVLVGERDISVMGDKETLFFGEDAFVTAKMIARKQIRGKEGFIIDTKQTYNWTWDIEVKNAHSDPIKVVLEDALPQCMDKRINLDIKSEPPAEVDKNTLRWKFTAKTGTTVIKHSVSIDAPANMNLVKGR